MHQNNELSDYQANELVGNRQAERQTTYQQLP